MPIEAAIASDAGVATGGRRWRPITVSVRDIRHLILWLLVASGSCVLIEPSPYEGMFVVALLVIGPRLSLDRLLVPLVVALTLLIFGELLSLVPWTDDHDSVTFTITSFYVSLTAIFFACLMIDDSAARMATIRRGYLVAAVIGSVAGILGYFDVAGLSSIFTLYNRATGTFKDPNVLGPFAAVAIVWITQDILLKTHGRGLLSATGRYGALLVIGFGLFLTFSRGAWGVCLASVGMMIALTFLTTSSRTLRRRIVVLAVVGTIGLVVLLAVALSFSSIRDVFLQRASLDQDYDLGETGRFGNQLRSLPLLLVSPNGFGPLQFRHLLSREDPHDVYINAFASNGWIGGFAYLMLIVATIYLGWRLAFKRTALQPHVIAVWSSLQIQIFQGFQIDTDHWRHFFLLLGCLWGLGAATRRYESL